jgi:hypothetical protein
MLCILGALYFGTDSHLSTFLHKLLIVFKKEKKRKKAKTCENTALDNGLKIASGGSTAGTHSSIIFESRIKDS